MKRTVSILGGVAVALAVCMTALGQNTVDPELASLRHEWAARFLEPGPHMELAKYFRKKGNPIQAFYILETARRYRFEQKVFDDAFLLHFGGFAPLNHSPAEEQRYLKLSRESPGDLKVTKHLADIYISRSEYAKAEPYLLSVLKKNPLDFSTLQALVEAYRRLGAPEKGRELVETFERDHPTSEGAYILRIRRILSTDALAARNQISEAVARFPREGFFHYAHGVLAEQKNDLDEAERSYLKAIELDPNSITYQAKMARFLRVHRKDEKRSIEYYLNVYFLDPHAHFDGHAEAKVAGLNVKVSKAIVDKAIAGGNTPQRFLGNPNPAVVREAMMRMVERWDSSKTDLMVGLMRHDDVLVRWTAMLALTEKEGRNLDTKLKLLLTDPDPRVRGLAIYMAVKLWKNESFPEAKKLLTDEAQLLRFDAMSALVMHGGPEGRQLVVEHRRKETNAYLNKLIDATIKRDEIFPK